VILTRAHFECTTPRDSLLIALIFAVSGVHLASLIAAFGTDHRLDTSKFDKVTELRCVEKIPTIDCDIIAVGSRFGRSLYGTERPTAMRPYRYRTYLITIDIGRHRNSTADNRQKAGVFGGSNHVVKCARPHPWLGAQAAHARHPGIELTVVASCLRERVRAAIVITDAKTQLPVPPCVPEGLDPRVFVRRHRLRCRLPPKPLVVCDEYGSGAHIGQGKRGGDTTESSTDDDGLSLC
jgi:hypothetical protein